MHQDSDNGMDKFINHVIGVTAFMFVVVVGGAALKYLLVGGQAPVPQQLTETHQSCTSVLWGDCTNGKD